jgi:phosphoribosylamine--glycine ligase
MTKIIEPTIKGLGEMGINYKGFLYVGLMIKENEPFLIEYNVRMGDPECQTILPKLKTDLLEIFLSCCDENLNTIKIEWHNKKSLCVVLCSKGYPDKFDKNVLIKNINKIKLNENQYCYHAGTVLTKDQIYATGGRVLNFVCLSDDFLEARTKVTNSISSLNWNGGFYRKDIGYKVID